MSNWVAKALLVVSFCVHSIVCVDQEHLSDVKTQAGQTFDRQAAPSWNNFEVLKFGALIAAATMYIGHKYWQCRQQEMDREQKRLAFRNEYFIREYEKKEEEKRKQKIKQDEETAWWRYTTEQTNNEVTWWKELFARQLQDFNRERKGLESLLDKEREGRQADLLAREELEARVGEFAGKEKKLNQEILILNKRIQALNQEILTKRKLKKKR